MRTATRSALVATAVAAAVVHGLTGCHRKAEGGGDTDATLLSACDCIGEPEQCVIDRLGRPDVELLGPNAFDKQLVYKKAQLTIDLMPRDAPRVSGVGTGAAIDVHHFGGDFAGSVFGAHHGDDIASVTRRWGPGTAPAEADAKIGNNYLRYPAKYVTPGGRKLEATVFYTNDKTGVFHFAFR
jgi:hypothetical protein